jgi:hypothetical protein
MSQDELALEAEQTDILFSKRLRREVPELDL